MVFHLFACFLDESVIAPEDLAASSQGQPPPSKWPAFTAHCFLPADKPIGTVSRLVLLVGLSESNLRAVLACSPPFSPPFSLLPRLNARGPGPPHCALPPVPLTDPARDVLKLRQATVRPPHFVLIVQGQQKPVVTGQNNLFHAIVLFLHYVNTQHRGFLLYGDGRHRGTGWPMRC